MIKYKQSVRAILNYIEAIFFRTLHNQQEKFQCPICKYHGPFKVLDRNSSIRKRAVCPNCKSLERHRLQKLVLDKLSSEFDFSRLTMLHFAPEPFLREYFKKRFNRYFSADLQMKNVDYNVDITDLPFPDNNFDFVFASHVLEHIEDDAKALSEIKRILSPGGFAILPVPVLGAKTIEYRYANPDEEYHVRAPGEDYFVRYTHIFSKMILYKSSDFDAQYQTYVYEDRSQWPNEIFPLRQKGSGERHLEFVPVCFV